jgi:NADH:ubiquinone oxidoreductase subunit 3 (subunit A)
VRLVLRSTLVELTNNVVFLKVVVLVGFGLGVLIFGLSALGAPAVWNLDKSGSYECGFDPFEDARSRFDVRFYLVALLFIIFDLEVAFLFPLVGGVFPVGGLAGVVTFLVILTAGFVYEWGAGALQWS